MKNFLDRLNKIGSKEVEPVEQLSPTCAKSHCACEHCECQCQCQCQCSPSKKEIEDIVKETIKEVKKGQNQQGNNQNSQDSK